MNKEPSDTCSRGAGSLGRGAGAVGAGAGPGSVVAGAGPLTPGGPGSRGPNEPSKLRSLALPRGPPRN